MKHSALLIERCDGLGPNSFASASVNLLIANTGVDSANDLLYEIAAVISLGHNAITAVVVVCIDRTLGPSIGTEAAGQVIEDVQQAVGALAGYDDASFVRVFAARYGGVNCQDEANEVLKQIGV